MTQTTSDQANTHGADQHALSAHEENKLIAQRREKLHAIQQKRNAFPNDFRRDTHAQDIHTEYADTSREDLEKLARKVKVAGRLIRERGPFLVIQDSTEALQLYVNHKALTAEVMDEIKALDLGDIVGVHGEVFRTGKGELTVNVESLRLLTKRCARCQISGKACLIPKCVIVSVMLISSPMRRHVAPLFCAQKLSTVCVSTSRPRVLWKWKHP